MGFAGGAPAYQICRRGLGGVFWGSLRGFAGGAPAYQICRRGWVGVFFCGSLWVSQAGRLRTRFVDEGGGIFFWGGAYKNGGDIINSCYSCYSCCSCYSFILVVLVVLVTLVIFVVLVILLFFYSCYSCCSFYSCYLVILERDIRR